jgi:ankyrin repeat protein
VKNKKILIGLGLLATCSLAILSRFQIEQQPPLSALAPVSALDLPDEALLAIVKNDQMAFESFLARGGKLSMPLPTIDGKDHNVIEGIVEFERVSFLDHLHKKKKNPDINSNILAMSIRRNNDDLLKVLVSFEPELAKATTDKGLSLLHIASAECADKTINVLHKMGLNWDLQSKDGSTPLTIAAQKNCLPALSYWKEHGADFKAKDGRGLSPLGILLQKKEPALLAFAQSFVQKSPASIGGGPAGEVNFYKKRIDPKDRFVTESDLIEPTLRPIDASETADYSEFSD